MSYLLICSVALVASGLTLFSGFGLGTLLLPAFALFFPLPVAVAMTAVVHLANNVFKLALIGRRMDRGVVLRFGLPALLSALVGAMLLGWLSGIPPLHEYSLGGRTHGIRPVALAMSILMIYFALLEVVPGLGPRSVDPRWLPLGGILSGFFGGLSGHQGALRSAFLLRFQKSLTKESFIATNVGIAVMVDVGRLAVYGVTFSWATLSPHRTMLAAATLSAFLGAYLGSTLLEKVTMRGVQWAVAVMLLLIAGALGSGLVG